MDGVFDIFVNGKPQQIPQNSGVNDLLSAINISSPKGIALAVNNNVVPRSEWDTYVFSAGDNVTLIKATQGG